MELPNYIFTNELIAPLIVSLTALISVTLLEAQVLIFSKSHGPSNALETKMAANPV